MALWDRWQAADGPGAEALLEQLREIQRAIGITAAEGVDALSRVLTLDEPQVVVSTQDLDLVIEQSRETSVSDFLEGVGANVAGTGAGLGSGTEERVGAIWSELLGVENIGRTDSFFDLGGNSLVAIQLASHLRRVFEIDLPIAVLFESKDLAALAAAVDAAVEDRRANAEIATLLDEIETLSEDEVRAELGRDLEAKADE
jgi:acyl carrier protein